MKLAHSPLVFLTTLSLTSFASAQSSTLIGPQASGGFGRSIGAAGDVNGDGLDDVIVGAPNAVNPSTGAMTGAARVYTASGTLVRTWYGTAAGDLFGWSVAGAGDVNGDGRADLIVGAPDARPNGTLRAGRATVFSGLNGAVLFNIDGQVPQQHLGYSVAGAGRVNADAFADVIAGSDWFSSGGPGYPGVATVYTGPTGTQLYTFTGDVDGQRFGRSVSSAGDVNGDGRSDLVVGSPFASGNAGYARVFSGANGQVLYTLTSAFPGFNFGWSVASAGDVTGDGRADIVVGQTNGTITGAVRGTAQVFDGVSQALVQGWEGDSVLEGFGTAVAGAGDIDRDGRADLLVGHEVGCGVRVFSGRTGLLLCAFTQGFGQGLTSVAALGNAISGAPLEIAFGAAEYNVLGSYPGAVWIHSTPSVFRFALGDGTGTPCPCDMNGAPGSGCANPVSASGARLDACGNASVSADSMLLTANGLPASAALIFQGTTQTNNGSGTPFGAGLLGVGGNVIRLAVKIGAPAGAGLSCTAGGIIGGNSVSYPEAGDPPISVRGMLPALGGSRNYQVWYRTIPQCGAVFNLTNGVSIAWSP